MSETRKPRRAYCGKSRPVKKYDHVCTRPLLHPGRCLCSCGVRFKPTHPYRAKITSITCLVLGGNYD